MPVSCDKCAYRSAEAIETFLGMRCHTGLAKHVESELHPSQPSDGYWNMTYAMDDLVAATGSSASSID
jgi:hypothetical protein